MQYCSFVLLSHSLSVKVASHVHHSIARPLSAAPQGGGLIGFFSVTTPSFSLQILKKEEAIPWPGTLAIVHSYIAYKEGAFHVLLSLFCWRRPGGGDDNTLYVLQLKKRRNRS